MDPINYLAAVPQEDFTRDIQGGLQLGLVYRQAQQQQAAQQLAQQRAVQYQADASAFQQNPTAQGALALSLKYPDQAKPITDAFGAYSADQQKVELRDAATLTNLLHADRSDLALQEIDQRIEAAKNSGLPTNQLEALKSTIQADPKAAYAHSLTIMAALPGGKDVLGNLQGINKDAREQAESDVKVAGQQSDNEIKNLGIVAQTAGSLAKPGVKPEQAITMFKSLEARGFIPKGGAQGYIDGMPADAKALPDYLKQVQAQGMTAGDQMKYTTPDANAQLSARTQVQTTGMNNATQLAVQDRIDSRAEKDSGDDAATFTPEAIDNAAARYNLDGSLPPMGMGKAAAAGRTKILNRAAELKAGISGEQQRRDQLNNKADIANKNKAVAAFNQGKQGNAIRSFNVLLTHLDTLDSLSDALDNGNIQAINKLGNAYAKATGKAAPTNFEAVKHIVGDEVVKAVTGGAGALGDRESIAQTINGTNSPEQLKGVIKNFKELAVGQLGGLEQQYQTSTGLNDFEHLLSPAARLMRAQHGGAPAPAAPAIPAGWVVRKH